MPAATPATVLVTGASGFLALHTTVLLLSRGYRVRGTLRDLSRADALRALLHAHAAFDDAALAFVYADLRDSGGGGGGGDADDGGGAGGDGAECWRDAVRGVRCVLHMAAPRDGEKGVVGVARGAVRSLMRAAEEAGVSKVVVTGSAEAVRLGGTKTGIAEDEWTRIEDLALDAEKSKLLVETDAWQYAENSASDMKLTVINPTIILGPTLSERYSVSLTVVKKLLDRAIPAVPKVGFPIIDVRDCAALHVEAMENPAADGERFLASTNTFMWYTEIAALLNQKLPSCQYRPVPQMLIPRFFIRMASLVDSDLRVILPLLGRKRTYSNDKARNVLGWTPQFTERDAVVDAAESLVQLGLVA